MLGKAKISLDDALLRNLRKEKGAPCEGYGRSRIVNCLSLRKKFDGAEALHRPSQGFFCAKVKGWT
jgi:hypothetical protein